MVDDTIDCKLLILLYFCHLYVIKQLNFYSKYLMTDNTIGRKLFLLINYTFNLLN